MFLCFARLYGFSLSLLTMFRLRGCVQLIAYVRLCLWRIKLSICVGQWLRRHRRVERCRCWLSWRGTMSHSSESELVFKPLGNHSIKIRSRLQSKTLPQSCWSVLDQKTVPLFACFSSALLAPSSCPSPPYMFSGMSLSMDTPTQSLSSRLSGAGKHRQNQRRKIRLNEYGISLKDFKELILNKWS